MFSSEPAASFACGRNVTLSNCPAPFACSTSTPDASSLYAMTTTPASAQKVQVPELMTGGKRSDEQLGRIPSRCIAAEHWIGRASYGPLVLRADVVRTRIGAVRRRAGARIAGSLDTNRIRVTLVCHGLRTPALG